MDNIRNVLKILFRYTSSQEALDQNNDYPYVDEKSFMALANVYMPQYSNNEIENMFRYLSSEFEWHNNKIRSKVIVDNNRKVNVFDALLLFVDNVLVEENGNPLCCYEHLLRWREMTVELDEDLFVTAFFAQKDLLNSKKDRRFFWSPVIGHNNKSLNRLMAQGVAENHFHLKGSAPLFHLSWCSMMMNVCNKDFKDVFDSYDDNRLHMNVMYRMKYADTSLYISYIQAALIRLYLFAQLMQEPFMLEREYIEYSQIEHYLDQHKIDGLKGPVEEKVCLEDYRSMFANQEDYDRFVWQILHREIDILLSDKQELQFSLGKIQNMIEYMQATYAPGQLDYTICHRYLIKNPDRRLNEVISGERWFLYEVFKKIYAGDQEFYANTRLFYAYLLIKENIRAELIQANHNVGFNNFLQYQERKESFVEHTAFEPVYLRMAVRDTILNQHIRKLEARITPKAKAAELARAITKNDNTILALEDGKDRRKLRKKFFYVCHFIKEADKRLAELEGEQERLSDYEPYCRHYELRNRVSKQAHAILELRLRNRKLGRRIRGIDASSEEIVCRPEVFAQAFRFLRNRSVSHIDYMTGVVKQLPDLCITYHVGEDFLDIIDGLRAIDEAVSFLNMRCGDRLGHALALGLDVEEWYMSKSGRILITQMDYLDNLVWLYSIIRKYRIEDCEDALHYIEKRYDEYFRIVYLNNMKEEYFHMVVDEAVQYYDERHIQNMYGNKTCLFPINTYYDSWKLRGDNPEYFARGFFDLEASVKTEWDTYGINKEFPENYRIRYNPEAAYLYHVYHYNPRVKREGNKCVEIKVNMSIIKAVKEVQQKLQWVIAQKGIGIETNPSSNALISTFKRYDKHPIQNWYNNGLVTDHKQLAEVAQIQVSINTDDQGVFATYIENEYAYLALALEKMKDEEGNPKYSRTIIYEWIDNIRKMGLTQSFAEMDEE